MSDPRIIKKYPNRRLYDTEVSAYITLEEVRELVKNNVAFKVMDNKSGEEITRSILLQIISEEEDHGTPVFTIPLLEQIIRFYGDALQAQGMLTEYLEKSMTFFTEQQMALRKQLPDNLTILANPYAFITRMAEGNFTLMEEWKKSFWSDSTVTRSSNDDKPKN